MIGGGIGRGTGHLQVYIGLGGNVGHREGYLAAGRAGIANLPGATLVGASRVYETSPVGPSTDPFLNQVVQVQIVAEDAAGLTELTDLMDHLLAIEQANGRERREKWGPRTLDLDMLLAVNHAGALLEIGSPTLTLPHPGLTDREFVLAPLAELASGLLIKQKTVDTWLAGLADDQRNVLRIRQDSATIL